MKKLNGEPEETLETCDVNNWPSTALYEESNWKIEKILNVFEKDGIRFFKVKLTKVVWQSEESLNSSYQILQNLYQGCTTDNISGVNNQSFPLKLHEEETSDGGTTTADLFSTIGNISSEANEIYSNNACSSNGETSSQNIFEAPCPDQSISPAFQSSNETNLECPVTSAADNGIDHLQASVTELDAMQSNVHEQIKEIINNEKNSIMMGHTGIPEGPQSLLQPKEYSYDLSQQHQPESNLNQIQNLISEVTTDFNAPLTNTEVFVKEALKSDNTARNLKSTITKTMIDSETGKNVTTTKKPSSGKAKRFVCEICDRSFDRKTSLQRHTIIHTGQKPWQCEYCMKSFNQNAILQRHLLTHENRRMYPCDQCEKSFVEKVSLKRHQATHSAEKQWKCDVCGKLFILKEYLAKHMFLHTGKKPHDCQTCGRKFADKCALKRHQRIHEKAKLKCKLCSKAFISSVAYTKHVSNCQIVYCIVCNLQLNNAKLYEKHQEIHTPPYICRICDASFNTINLLSEHTQSEHKEQNFECSICTTSEIFTSEELLQEHVASIHSSRHINLENVFNTPVSDRGQYQTSLTHSKEDGANRTNTATSSLQLPTENFVNLKSFELSPVKNIAKITPKSFDELFKSALIP